MAWRALVLGGGGAKGEFEVGVLEIFAKNGWNFDFFSGVSVGALNVSILAQYAKLADGVAALKSLWDGIDENKDIYTATAIPKLPAPLNLSSLAELFSLMSSASWAPDSIYDGAPLRKRIAANVEWERLEKSKKTWAIGVTSLTDGLYYLITNNQILLDKSMENLGDRLRLNLKRGVEGSIPDRVIDFILASASMPFLFPPVDLYDHRFVDGGLRDITPLSAAFSAARQVDDPDKQIVVVSTQPKDLQYLKKNALDSGREILIRSIDIMTHEILENDIKEAEDKNTRGGGYLSIKVASLRPAEPAIVDFGSLDFEASRQRAALREHGRAIATRYLRGKEIS